MSYIVNHKGKNSDCYVVQYDLEMVIGRGLKKEEKTRIFLKKERKRSLRISLIPSLEIKRSSLELGYVILTKRGCVIHCVHYVFKNEFKIDNNRSASLTLHDLTLLFIQRLYETHSDGVIESFAKHFKFETDEVDILFHDKFCVNVYKQSVDVPIGGLNKLNQVVQVINCELDTVGDDENDINKVYNKLLDEGYEKKLLDLAFSYFREQNQPQMVKMRSIKKSASISAPQTSQVPFHSPPSHAIFPSGHSGSNHSPSTSIDSISTSPTPSNFSPSPSRSTGSASRRKRKRKNNKTGDAPGDVPVNKYVRCLGHIWFTGVKFRKTELYSTVSKLSSSGPTKYANNILRNCWYKAKKFDVSDWNGDQGIKDYGVNKLGVSWAMLCTKGGAQTTFEEEKKKYMEDHPNEEPPKPNRDIIGSDYLKGTFNAWLTKEIAGQLMTPELIMHLTEVFKESNNSNTNNSNTNNSNNNS